LITNQKQFYAGLSSIDYAICIYNTNVQHNGTNSSCNNDIPVPANPL